MEPNLMNYGYPPTYHQLQGQANSFDQIQPISHLSPEIPLLSNGIQHQTVSSTQSSSSSDFSDQFVVIKTEDDEDKLQLQQQQTQLHPQRPQYLPSIFNTHPYQSMAPISWENNFNYHQYQYNPMAYHHQLPPLDHRLMQQPPISYSGAAMHHHAYATNGTLPSFHHQQQHQSPLYDEAIQSSPNMEMSLGIHSSEQEQQQLQLQQQPPPININEG
jgi:hypothetical protein